MPHTEKPNYVYNKACIRLLITESVHTKIIKLSISKAFSYWRAVYFIKTNKWEETKVNSSQFHIVPL